MRTIGFNAPKGGSFFLTATYGGIITYFWLIPPTGAGKYALRAIRSA